MVKTVPFTKCNTVTNYKGRGLKWTPHKPFLTVSRGSAVACREFNPPDPSTNTTMIARNKIRHHRKKTV